MKKVKYLAKATSFIVLSTGYALPAMATQGDVYAIGTKYCASTYAPHPSNPVVGGIPVDLNVGDGWYDNKHPLLAPEDGSVSIVSYDNGKGTGWGNSITWTNGDETLYLAHLYDFGKTGPVDAGEIIGYVGNTGYSKGPHLHIQSSKGKLILSGNSINPANYPACKPYTSKGPVIGGPGGPTPPTDPPASGKLPDFITSKVTMGNKDGKHEKYTWKINETAYVHDYIDNIGTADWEGKAKKIKVPFYLSKGTKEDSHSEWVRVSRQEIKREHLKVKDKPKHEYIKFNLAEWANDSTVLPGRTYNFVVCADRPKDENNGDGDVKEKHKSNNCSTEAVFYVDFGPARNVDLIADNLALTGGRTELQAGEKYGLQVEVSNIGTEQPWNGFRTKYEIKGPGTGGVWQKIGDEHSKASSLYAGAIHFESMTGDDEVSAPMVGGDYVFRACADYEQVVPETDESNNCSAELPVTVIAPPPPAACVILNPLASLPATGSFDLAATSIEFPDVIQQGDEMHPKAQVCGVSGTSPKTRATWAYANCDGTGFTAFDGDTDDGLSAGECVTEENKEGDDLANMPPGRYVMYFIANGETQIPESDHSNNVTAKVFVVE